MLIAHTDSPHLRQVSAPLAEAGISILYQSSYFTDFILVKEIDFEKTSAIFAQHNCAFPSHLHSVSSLIWKKGKSTVQPPNHLVADPKSTPQSPPSIPRLSPPTLLPRSIHRQCQNLPSYASHSHVWGSAYTSNVLL